MKTNEYMMRIMRIIMRTMNNSISDAWDFHNPSRHCTNTWKSYSTSNCIIFLTNNYLQLKALKN